MAPTAPRQPSHRPLGWLVTSRHRPRSAAAKATRYWLAPKSWKRQPAHSAVSSEPTGYEAPQRNQAVLCRRSLAAVPPWAPAVPLA